MSQRKNCSEIWKYFQKTRDGKAVCKTCRETFSFKSTTSNLKVHLKRKHASFYVRLPSVVEKSNLVINRPVPITDTSSLSMTTTMTTVAVQQGSSSSNILISPPEPSTSAVFVVEGPRQSNATEVLGNKRRLQDAMDSNIAKISKEQKKLIDNDVLDLCIDAFHPFSIVEERSFKNLMRWIPGYTLPSRKTLSKNYLGFLYNKTKKIIFDEVAAQCETMCITFDSWTSRKTESYIAVTGHYINKNFELKTVLLDCCNFEGHQTAQNIAVKIRKVTDEWHVTHKVNFAVSDNASNVTSDAITSHLQWKHYGCYAYKLNLVLQHSLMLYEDSLIKVKQIVAFFKKSVTATEKLDQQQINNNKTPKRLIQEVETRWNSTFCMLKRFTDLRDEIEVTLAIFKENLPTISEKEWLTFSQLCRILKPFEEITGTISSEKYLTGSDIMVVTRILKDTCQRFRGEELDERIQRFIDALETNIDAKIGNLEKNEAFSLSTFLDPRYKMAAFSDQMEAAHVKQKVQDKVQQLIAEHRIETASCTKISTSSSLEKETSVWDVFEKYILDKASSQQGTPAIKALKEVQMYVDDEILPRKDSSGHYNCPGKWWLAHKHVYPNLATIYKNNCNLVGTSVPCERMFSKTGFIISDRRASLTTKKVRELMFLNVNMDQNRFDN